MERVLGNDIESILKNRAKVRSIRTRLLNLHFESAQEQAWKTESETTSFVREYVDNETQLPRGNSFNVGASGAGH